jgi:hypothetical protein
MARSRLHFSARMIFGPSERAVQSLYVVARQERVCRFVYLSKPCRLITVNDLLPIVRFFPECDLWTIVNKMLMFN